MVGEQTFLRPGGAITAKILQGSKPEIAERLMQIPGDTRDVIVVVEQLIPAPEPPAPGEDIFAEMEPYVVHVGDADWSREAIYTRMEGE
jgi:hypothetical protein